jgi:hypothetical protein
MLSCSYGGYDGSVGNRDVFLRPYCIIALPCGVIARARSLISNTLLERLGEGGAEGVNVLMSEENGFELLEQGAL